MLVERFELEDANAFLRKAMQWSQQFNVSCLLHSNSFVDTYSALQSVLAVEAEYTCTSNAEGTFNTLQQFKTEFPDRWILGFFGYDLKEDLEDIKTTRTDYLGFPEAYFFIPRTIIQIHDRSVDIQTNDDPQQIFEAIHATAVADPDTVPTFHGDIRKRMSKAEYMHAFQQLQKHIRRGDIYEVNLCQEFYAEHVEVDPTSTYWRLNETSPMPFSSFFKLGDRYILSASPERFLAKRGDVLVSQPIKGTARRGMNPQEDDAIVQKLKQDPKEIAENIMIVDLVRNDLTRCAKAGTVAAERRLEVHSFQHVHQLISTVTCEISPDMDSIAAIQQVFPAGSMTGAPKISAMQLCERYEKSKRGVYAGAIGYFNPDGDFDFNVVIRTLLLNQSKKLLSFHTGGAITLDAQPEQEYQECLTKAQAIMCALQAAFSDEDE